MVPPYNLSPDLYDTPINETLYRGMIGSLMYPTASQPDIQFSTCICARYQANPKESPLTVVMRIFRYLKGTPTLADLVDVVTIGIPSLTGDEFTKETIRVEYEWRPPRCDECKIFGHIHDHFPKKAESPPIVTTSNAVAPTVENPSVKQTVRYEPKATPSAPKKGTTNVNNPSKSSSMLKTTDTSPTKDNFTTSNSFSTLNDEKDDDEEIENVYDESANLFKYGGSSSFTVAAG
ncbi:hypothetical protein Tco_1428543 [Tanacetum coccineum]